MKDSFVLFKEFLQYYSSPKQENMSLAVTMFWNETEKNKKREIEIKNEFLCKRMAEMIWLRGKRPLGSYVEFELENYEKSIGIGLFSEVIDDKTYAQKFYSLMVFIEKLIDEIGYIQSRWWYKFFKLFYKE